MGDQILTIKQLKEIIKDLPDDLLIPETTLDKNDPGSTILEWNVSGKGFVELFIGGGFGDGFIYYLQRLQPPKKFDYSNAKLLELLTELYNLQSITKNAN